MSDIFYNPDDRTHITRRHLPHWEQQGKVYFITFRLADSIPQKQMEKLRQEQVKFKLLFSPPYTKEQEKQYRNLFYGRLEEYLDDGYGQCLLRESDCQNIVKQALEYFEGQRYILDHWVIMPNHVHVLMLLLAGFELERILHSWKSYTANQINELSGQCGTVWQHESFDHIVRGQLYLEKYRKYIISNKRKAGERAMLSQAMIEVE